MSSCSQSSQWSGWVAILNIPTLIASISPVLLGISLASMRQTNIDHSVSVLCLITALFLQVSVNFANDYFDWKNGIDTKEHLGPHKPIVEGSVGPTLVLYSSLASLGLAFCSILTLLCQTRLWLFSPLAILFLLLPLAYSGGSYPLANWGVGEVTVLTFFGWVPSLGTFYCLTKSWSSDAFFLGSGSGFISATLLLTNNIRDMETDSISGKYTLPWILSSHYARWFRWMHYFLSSDIPVPFYAPLLLHKMFLLGSLLMPLLASSLGWRWIFLLYLYPLSGSFKLLRKAVLANKDRILWDQAFSSTGKLFFLYLLLFFLSV